MMSRLNAMLFLRLTFLFLIIQVLKSNLAIPDKTNCIKGMNICMGAAKFPKKKADSIIEKNKFLQSFFQSKDEVLRKAAAFNTTRNQGQELCKTRVRRYEPTRAKNIYGEWRNILQGNDKRQSYLWEICMQEDCRRQHDIPVPTKCQQKEVMQHLIVINDDFSTGTDLFHLPCCCVCTFLR